MKVLRSVFMFAEMAGVGDKYTSYAMAKSCNCKGGCKRGNFSISTEGTGLKFSNTVSSFPFHFLELQDKTRQLKIHLYIFCFTFTNVNCMLTQATIIQSLYCCYMK